MKRFRSSTTSRVSLKEFKLLEHFPKPYTKAEARMLVAEEDNKD